MNFELDEDQQALADTVRRYLRKNYGFETRQGLLGSPLGYDEQAWAAFAEMGVFGLPVPEEFGGFGGGAVALSGIMECFGEALSLEPVLSTLALGARMVVRGGTASQQARLLPAIANGSMRIAFAHVETGSRYDLDQVAATARRCEGGWTVSGIKRVVLDAPSAQALLVSARTAGLPGEPAGISLFIVDPAAPEVELRPYRTLDGRRAADVVLRAATVASDGLVGAEGGALGLVEEAVDFATALLCAEAVGVMADANAATLEFLKTRKQFGVAIGSFQVLQHRMVDMFIAAEQSRSMSYLACASVDTATDSRERARVVSAAKVLVAQACRLVSQQSVQLHGGMGLTEEMKISHAFRRLTVIAGQFGDDSHHLERFACSPDSGRI